jgi:hypothetical protein
MSAMADGAGPFGARTSQLTPFLKKCALKIEIVNAFDFL